MEEARDAEGDRGPEEDEPPGVHQYQRPATAATNVITLMYPFTLKKAMSSFERSLADTSECS